MAGPLPVAALAWARSNFYLTEYTTGIIATGQGAPLKGIPIALRKPPFYLVAEPSIQDIDDLAGKRIGVDRIGGLPDLVVRLLMHMKAPTLRKRFSLRPARCSIPSAVWARAQCPAAVLSGPHNVVMGQEGFRQVGAADELPMQFSTSGLVVRKQTQERPTASRMLYGSCSTPRRFAAKKILGRQLHPRQVEGRAKNRRNGVRPSGSTSSRRMARSPSRTCRSFSTWRIIEKRVIRAGQRRRGHRFHLDRSGVGGKVSFEFEVPG